MSASKTVPPSLHSLRSHRIFLPNDTSSSSKAEPDADWELIDELELLSEEDVLGHKLSKVVLRDKDLIVAHGKNLRITSIGGEDWTLSEGFVGSYKEIKSPRLSFPIHRVLLNPTGRLLAVIGLRQIAIIVLPRTGHVGTSSGVLECRSFYIDPFQFASTSKPIISKVIWHPWGENGNSVWILTTDGKLREYDVLKPEDPAQTFTFLPEVPTSRFSAIDPLSLYATSFSFSLSACDFGRLSVYVTMANGDLYLMSPVMPLHTEMPLRYIQGLKRYVDESGDEAERRWVDALVRQVRAFEGAGRLDEDDGQAKSSNEGGTWQAAGEKETMVKLHPPHLTESGGPAPGAHRALARQGPIISQPGPPDDEDEEDQRVLCDMTVKRVQVDDDDGRDHMNILLMIWNHGRLDIGLEIEKPRPQWISTKPPSRSIPAMPFIESIYLDLAAQKDDDMPYNSPGFTTDALQHDMIYIRHTCGLECVSFAPWLSKLREKGRLPPSKVERLIELDGSDHQVLTGLITFCNLTLGYGLLGLARCGSVAAIELDFRAADTSSDTATPPADNSNETDDPALAGPALDVHNLLIASPLDLDQHLDKVRSLSANPQDVLRKLPSRGQPIESISSDHLRAFGHVTSGLHARIQAVRVASQIVEARLSLQIQEFQRQLRLLKSTNKAYAVLKTKSPGIADRAGDMIEKQRGLSERLDAVISAMAAEQRPEVGKVEQEWFDELDQVKEKLGGDQGEKGRGMRRRIQSLREQIDAIKPNIHEQAEGGQVGGEVGRFDPAELGVLESAVSSKGEEIKRLSRKVEALTIRLDGIAATRRL